MNNTTQTWTATPTTKTIKIDGLSHRVRGTGVSLFGNRLVPTAKGSHWLERRFETFAAAGRYAAKIGVTMKVEIKAELPTEFELREQLGRPAAK